MLSYSSYSAKPAQSAPIQYNSPAVNPNYMKLIINFRIMDCVNLYGFACDGIAGLLHI